jgi:hypothetical protein
VKDRKRRGRTAWRRVNQGPSCGPDRENLWVRPGERVKKTIGATRGLLLPKSSRATGPSKNAESFRLATSSTGKPGACLAGWGWRYLSGFSGERRERGVGATRNRRTEIPPGDKPRNRCGSREPFIDSQGVGRRSGRASLGQPPRQPHCPACADCIGCFEPRPAERPNVPMGHHPYTPAEDRLSRIYFAFLR